MPGWETEAQGTQPVATKPGPSPPLRSPCLGLSLPFCARLWAQPCACTEALARRRQGSRMLIQPRGGSKMVRNEGSRLLWGRLCPSSRSSTPPPPQPRHHPGVLGFPQHPPRPPAARVSVTTVLMWLPRPEGQRPLRLRGWRQAGQGAPLSCCPVHPGP